MIIQITPANTITFSCTKKNYTRDVFYTFLILQIWEICNVMYEMRQSYRKWTFLGHILPNILKSERAENDSYAGHIFVK